MDLGTIRSPMDWLNVAEINGLLSGRLCKKVPIDMDRKTLEAMGPGQEAK